MSSQSTELNRELASTVQRRRAELRGAMSDLEVALSAPSAGRGERWLERVRAALSALRAGWREHRAVTEGPEGLHQELVEHAPRLAGPVSRLTGEHALIQAQLEGVLEVAGPPDASVEELREAGMRLLDLLMRHRQRGADLVYEAYEFDVGGSD